LVPCVDRLVAGTIVERLQAFDLPPKAVSANTSQGGWNEEGRRRRVRDRGRRDAGPGHVGEIEQGGWSNPYLNDELATWQSEQLVASDALLLGRVTFEGFAAAWPSMEETKAAGSRPYPATRGVESVTHQYSTSAASGHTRAGHREHEFVGARPGRYVRAFAQFRADQARHVPTSCGTPVPAGPEMGKERRRWDA
jgi:hypothetical protein